MAGTPGFAPWGDPADYDRYGAWLAAFSRFPPTTLAAPGGPTAFRPPAYPLLLAGVYEVTGARWTAGRLVGVALGVLAVLLLYLIARRLFGRRVALCAAALAAIFPPLVWLNGSLPAESLFVPLVLGALLALLRHRDAPGPGWAAAAGGLVALAALTRANGAILLIPAVPAVAMAARGRRSRRGVRRAPVALAALVVAFGVVLAPWTIRNEITFHRLLPLGTGEGYTVAGYFNPEVAAPGPFQAISQSPELLGQFAPLFHQPVIDEGALSATLGHSGLDFVADHPGYLPHAVWRDALRLVDLGPNHHFTRMISYKEMGIPPGWWGAVSVSLYAALLLAAAGVAAVGRRRLATPWFAWAFPVLLWLSVLWLGKPRYRIPVDPFMLMLAAVALVAAGDALARRWRSRAGNALPSRSGRPAVAAPAPRSRP